MFVYLLMYLSIYCLFVFLCSYYYYYYYYCYYYYYYFITCLFVSLFIDGLSVQGMDVWPSPAVLIYLFIYLCMCVLTSLLHECTGHGGATGSCTPGEGGLTLPVARTLRSSTMMLRCSSTKPNSRL